MANAPKTLALTIMEREYRVNCPAGAEEDQAFAGHAEHAEHG